MRFGSGKNEVIVPGTFVNHSTVSCITPNFETYGAMEIDVRVNIANEGWTAGPGRPLLPCPTQLPPLTAVHSCVPEAIQDFHTPHLKILELS